MAACPQVQAGRQCVHSSQSPSPQNSFSCIGSARFWGLAACSSTFCDRTRASYYHLAALTSFAHSSSKDFQHCVRPEKTFKLAITGFTRQCQIRIKVKEHTELFNSEECTMYI